MIKKEAVKLPDYTKKSYAIFMGLLVLGLGFHQPMYSAQCIESTTMTYYLYVSDFINSLIAIPTSNVSGSSTTITSNYIAGRAPIYNVDNTKAGICSASFLSMETPDGIFTDISNYLSVDNGLIVYWLTPTTLINLELDSIINGMVTECTVMATTKIGVNPFFGQTFNLIVSSDGGKIYFQFSRVGTIF